MARFDLGWEDATMRLTDLTRRYLADPRYVESVRSKETYDHCIRQFMTYLEGAGAQNSVESFTPENVEGFVEYLYAVKKLSNTSVNLRLSALSGLAQYAMQNNDERTKKRYMTSNPVQFVKRPKNERPVSKYLTAAEVRALLNVECEPNEKLALALLFDTQLRASAAAEAKVKDLTLDGDRVLLTVVEKGDNPDTFVLGPELAEALVASLRLREAGKEETLLLNCKGEPYTRQTLSEMVARLARRAGITRIRVGAHLFARHSPASLAGQDGASTFEIAAMLRHRDPNTAKRYVHGVTADATRARVRDLVRA